MEKKDREIIFSKTIKSSKRIYYLDVKKNRKGEFFLAITESKKIISSGIEVPQVTFEKHKIFLYKEDMENFLEGLLEVISYINQHDDSENPEIDLREVIKLKFEDLS